MLLMKKEYLILLLIIIFAAFLRLFKLGIIPAGVTHDELGYIYNAYSIAKTGRNIFGEFLPFLTWIHEGGWPYLPIPIYISVPFFWLFDLSATTGRLPSAILGIADVLLIFILVKQIFNKPLLALLSAFFLAISPWHLHFSRSAYDPNFALFFYLIGLVLFIREAKMKKAPILSLLSFLLAIFSYRGMNILFIPIVVILAWYGAMALQTRRKQLAAFLVGAGIILLLLLTVVVTNRPRYTAEAFTFSNPKIQEDIDTQIREAQGLLFIRRLFLNKPTYIIGKLRENYIKSYSPEFLFLYTEPSKIYSIWSRGRIYFIDLILIILGIAYLYKTNKKGASFIVGMILIGGLPGMLGGMPYSARNFFMAAFLPILVAAGTLFLLNNSWLKRLKAAVVVVLIAGYSYIFAGYLFDYYGRYALYGGEAWVKSLKDMSSLIIKEQNNYNKIIVGQASFGDFLQYAFYSKAHPSQVQQAWQNKVGEADQSFSLDSASFVSKCLEDEKKGLPLFDDGGSVLYFVREDCAKLATPSSVLRDYHRNTIWKVYRVQHE